MIPINTTTGVQGTKGILYRRNDDTLHMKIAGIEPTSYTEVRAFEEQELERERVRLWYVACTRARDLLVLPRHEDPPKGSWAKVLDLHVDGLSPISPSVFKVAAPELVPPAQNQQDKPTFIREDAVIAASWPEVHWIQPSRRDGDRSEESDQRIESPEKVVYAEPAVKPVGSALRGSVLHKLMEEILNGLLRENSSSIASRADELIRQLSGTPKARPEEGPCPKEMADTVLNVLSLPWVREFRARLKPEFPLFSARKAVDNRLRLVGGVADAVALGDSSIDLVVDWKSDIDVDSSARSAHFGQMQAYLEAADCRRGAVIYMTTGIIQEVQRKPLSKAGDK